MYHPIFKKPLAGLAVAFLSLLVGCSSTPEYARELPPVELLADCVSPSVDIRTNGGLAKGVQDLRAAIATCNIDKQALRLWASETR